MEHTNTRGTAPAEEVNGECQPPCVNMPDEIRGTNSSPVVGKLQLWERKLLDMSLRNNLINIRTGRNSVALKPLPLKEVLALLDEEKLDTLLDDDDRPDVLKNLYRAARNSVEENGANTLFLSLGILRWREEGSDKTRQAPIILLPVEIVRHSSKKYTIRERDDETIINITLMECLRQLFELDVPDFSQLPAKEDGEVDMEKVFALLRDAVSEKPGWEVVEEAMLGIFSFTKFVMWNDLHTHHKELRENVVLRSLMEGKVQWQQGEDAADARSDDDKSPSLYAVPLDVDSSQLEAVIESGKGHSFILYGPPGTGKSQTITNMVANALYQGKRVLFVAEKKAALEVVQRRLAKMGLDPFCLELHSNKVQKKHFLAQMDKVLSIPHSAPVMEFLPCADDLLQRRRELNSYVEALHRKGANGLSLYECINHYLEADGEAVNIPFEAVAALGQHELEEWCDRFVQLDTVVDILRMHPSRHPLLHLLPRANTRESLQALQETLAALPAALALAEKKAQGWLNRTLFKKTPRDLLAKQPLWNRLQELAHIPEEVLADMERFKAELAVWQANTALLHSWCHYSLRALELQKLPVEEAVHYFLRGKGGRQTADALRKGVYCSLAMNLIDDDEHLRSFNGMLFEQAIESFRKLTKEFQELTKKELFYRLSTRIPTEADSLVLGGEELTVLKKRISNRGRGTTIRRIIEQIPHLLPRLTPCMLMSPLSVAQYLKMDGEKFDLVIFDEASQMPTSEAVGAIARGKALVVVGDPKQMPPTNFFNAQTTTEEEWEIDDLDSILDDCIALSMTSRYLNWHYRSRHESLIAFSNAHFYEGRLTTFPSVDDCATRVSLRPVEGHYDYGRTRSNKAEAEAIVEEVMKRLREQQEEAAPMASIGIVAFSKVQSELIEDLLTESLAKQTDLEQLAYHSEEPVFVKNLENVQGDERDIILFSVGYGPDEQGKVSMNFGPLNQSGGERRLNVAVTRARKEMMVFSTLQPEQIDLDRTSAQGVLGLKRFLEYARDGHFPVPQQQAEKEETDVIIQKIAHRLRTMGYECRLGIGRSKFKVHIAVLHPTNPDKYLLGIQLDDSRYYQTSTAQDREMVQPGVLQGLGWKLFRVWTIDWLTDEERVMQMLMEAVEEQQAADCR